MKAVHTHTAPVLWQAVMARSKLLRSSVAKSVFISGFALCIFLFLIRKGEEVEEYGQILLMRQNHLHQQLISSLCCLLINTTYKPIAQPEFLLI